MRKILIMILIAILLAALGMMMVKGLSVGPLKINSIQEIIDDNAELQDEIAKLSYTIDNDYQNSKAKLSNNVDQLLKTRQEYQDAITYSTEEEIRAATQTEGYKLDYLWTKVRNVCN